jgi:hypothetical protein
LAGPHPVDGGRGIKKFHLIIGISAWILFAPCSWGQGGKSNDKLTSPPLALRVQNEVIYDPVRGARDVATTMTLNRADLAWLMRALKLPRAGELEGRMSGSLAVQVAGGEWRRISLRLRDEPGTVRLSRQMLKDFIALSYKASPGLAQTLSPQRIDAALDGAFGKGTAMIPLEGVAIEGELSSRTLNLKIPAHNQALNLLIEPHIERKVLWDAWRRFKPAGFVRIESK